jgi:NAD-dependent dihydropyrimidine dehydrogenase PreA subunit
MDEEPTLWSSVAEHWDIARSLRGLRIYFDPGRCIGDWLCYEVCPVGCWKPDLKKGKALFTKPERCVACGACSLQCPGLAIELR